MAEKSGVHKIVVKTPTDTFELEGRPCQLSAFSFIPKRRNLPQERTFFNSPKTLLKPYFDYDIAFPHIIHDYNQKSHRCDRRFAKMIGLNTNAEEFTKPVPSLSSTYYGFYLDRSLDKQSRQYTRIMRVNEFFRRNGAFQKEDRKG